jgi:drug/metabolite transporter (DMT)-like permease
MHSTERRAYLAWIVVCIVWGTTYLAIRVALETMPPMLMAAFRWLTAGCVLLTILIARGEVLPSRRDWPALALLGVLMMSFGNGGVVWAEQTVPSGLTAVLVSGVPFWMTGIERVGFGGEPLSARRVFGLIVGFAGIVLLVWPELQLGHSPAFLVGVAATQIACLGWAIGSSLARRRHHEENILAVSALQMIFSGVSLLAVALAIGEWPALAVNARTGGALAYLIVIGSIVGYSAYAYALRHLPVTTVSLYAYVNPVIAVALGTLILGEPFNSRILIASAIVLAGIMLVRGTSAQASLSRRMGENAKEVM